MRRNQFFTLRMSFTLLLILNLVACGSIKNGNFNRRKFTKLKKIELKVALDTEVDVKYELSESYATDEAQLADDVVAANGDAISVESLPFISEVPAIVPAIPILKSPELIPRPPILGRPNEPGNKDFKTFTQVEKNQAIIHFNTLLISDWH